MNDGGSQGGGISAYGACPGNARSDSFGARDSGGTSCITGRRSKKPPMDETACCAAPSASAILPLIAEAILGPAKTVRAVASVKMAIVPLRLNPLCGPAGRVGKRMLHSSNFASPAPCHYPGDAISGESPS